MSAAAVAGSNVDNKKKTNNKNKMKLLLKKREIPKGKRGIERFAHAQVVAERRLFTYKKKKKIIEKILAYF